MVAVEADHATGFSANEEWTFIDWHILGCVVWIHLLPHPPGRHLPSFGENSADLATKRASRHGIGPRVCDPQQLRQLASLRMARPVLNFHVAAVHRAALRTERESVTRRSVARQRVCEWRALDQKKEGKGTFGI
jgi:hypothetical protein